MNVWLKISADHACDGTEKWKFVKIDFCIATIVAALQRAGIDMTGSCCGHGRGDGNIALKDGRVLVIKENGQEYLARR